MKLYLAHHGEAVHKKINPERPLTDKGKKDLEKMALFLEEAGVTVERVIHSTKIRAIDTAAILAHRLAPGHNHEKMKGIKPDDAIDHLVEKIGEWKGNILIAGHGPFFSRLTAQLLADRQEPDVIATRPGSVICLERDQLGAFHLAWMIRPELLP